MSLHETVHTRVPAAAIYHTSSSAIVAADILIHYRTIINHCGIIDLKIYKIRWKTQSKGYYGVKGHSRSSRSVQIESPYATSY